MIISTTTYYIIVGLIIACGILPVLYGRITKTGRFGWTWIIILFTIPLNWYTPTIYNVSDCDVYTKEVLFLPKGDFDMGQHNYIVNNSDKELFFEYIVYGSATLDEDEMDLIIEPGTTCEVPVISIDYLFKDAPESVSSKSAGETKYRLSCDVPDWEEDEEIHEHLDEPTYDEGERSGVENVRIDPLGE